VVREQDSRELINSATVFVSWGQDKGWRGMGGESGCVLASLGKGTYDFIVSAKGYDTVVYRSVEVPTGGAGELGIAGISKVEAFTGPTVVLGAKLKKSAGASPALREVSLVTDTEYYWRTDTPPSPVGGTNSILKKIDLSKLNVHPDSTLKVYVQTGVFIDALGHPVRVGVDEGDLPQSLEASTRQALSQMVREAISSTEFTPARLLGQPVKSHLYIPFEFELKAKK
jgi:hypothetical protein